MYSKLWNCNRLWKIWYALLITILQLYVTYNSIRNYVIFKSLYFNPRYGGVWNFGPLNFYIGCIIASISVMCFFIYFCVISIPNPSNADIKSILNMEHEHLNVCYGPLFRLVSKLMKEKLPYAPMLHLLMAVILMLPIPVVQMEQIRNEALSSKSIQMANFDFFSDHFSWLLVSSLKSENIYQDAYYLLKPTVLNLEFINFVIASVIFLISMPSVLWYSNKWFSIFYSAIIFVNCLTWLIIYEAGSILIKASENTSLMKLTKNPPNLIHYSVMLLLIGIHFLLILLGFIAIFDYGQTQSAICWLRGLKTFNCISQSGLRKNCCIFSVVAVGFSLLLVTLVIDSFIFVEFYNFQASSNMSIFIVAIIFGIINLVVQFLVWFTFSIKYQWVFYLDIPGIVQNATRINDSVNKYPGSPDTIYGCFHNNITLSTSSSHSSGRGTSRTMEGSSSDSACYGNNNYQNYVYLQSPTTQIPTISEDYDENNTSTSQSSSINAIDNRNNSIIDHEALYRTTGSISDNGINKINDGLSADSYRSLQMINNRRSGKLVTFHDVNEEKLPFFGIYEKRYSNSNMEPLNFLKVPDILNLNRSTLSASLSDSSLDQISSSMSSKVAMETTENGMCSEV